MPADQVRRDRAGGSSIPPSSTNKGGLAEERVPEHLNTRGPAATRRPSSLTGAKASPLCKSTGSHRACELVGAESQVRFLAGGQRRLLPVLGMLLARRCCAASASRSRPRALMKSRSWLGDMAYSFGVGRGWGRLSSVRCWWKARLFIGRVAELMASTCWCSALHHPPTSHRSGSTHARATYSTERSVGLARSSRLWAQLASLRYNRVVPIAIARKT